MLANFVSVTDFATKPYQLPPLTEFGTAFDDFVTKFQQDILLELLGQLFYDAFDVGLAALPASYNPATNYGIGGLVVYGSDIWSSLVINNLGNTPGIDLTKWQKQNVNRWLKLRGGDTYKNSSSKKFNWLGMKNMLIPFIYVNWIRDQSTSIATSGGVVSTNMENSNSVSIAFKISDAHLDFVIRAGNCHEIQNNNRGSLFGYLWNNESTFVADVVDAQVSTFQEYLKKNFTLQEWENELDL